MSPSDRISDIVFVDDLSVDEQVDCEIRWKCIELLEWIIFVKILKFPKTAGHFQFVRSSKSLYNFFHRLWFYFVYLLYQYNSSCWHWSTWFFCDKSPAKIPLVTANGLCPDGCILRHPWTDSAHLPGRRPPSIFPTDQWTVRYKICPLVHLKITILVQRPNPSMRWTVHHGRS